MDAKIMDALREVSNIGCGHAATAFARMLGSRVLVQAPRSAEATRAEIARRLGEADLVTISFGVHGGAQAHIVLAFRVDDARRLGAALLRGNRRTAARSDEAIGDDAAAAITEMGNILASAYLNAVGRLAQITLIPTLPELALGDQTALADRLATRAPGLLVESSFDATGGALGAAAVAGKVLLLGTGESLRPLLLALDVG